MKTTNYTWGESKFEFYKPKMNSYKRAGVFGFIALCLATPGTNWLMVPFSKLIISNLGWLYR